MPSRPARGSRGSSLLTGLGILLGALITLGLLMFHIAYLVPMPCTNPPYCPTTSPELQNYANLVTMLTWVAFTAMDVAVGVSVIVAFLLGAGVTDIPEPARRGFFIFATVFTAVWVIFGTYIVLTVLASVRYYL